MAKKKKAARRKKPDFALGVVYMDKDPRVYEDKVKDCDLGQKRVLGLDLGTKCGVAFCDFTPGQPIQGAMITMGQWDLSLGPYDSGPLRHIRLKQFLAIVKPDLVMYEEVKYDPPQDVMKSRGHGMGGVVARVATAAEFLGGLKTTLAVWAEERQIPAHGIAIAAIKKYATDKGNASKEMMIAAANEKFMTNFAAEDYDKTGVDNIVDAAFVCDMGVTLYSEGLA